MCHCLTSAGWIDTWRRYGKPLTNDDVQQIYVWDSQTLRFPFDDRLLDLSGELQLDMSTHTRAPTIPHPHPKLVARCGTRGKHVVPFDLPIYFPRHGGVLG